MATYKEAIEWIVLEDDIDFLNDYSINSLSVTASMVRDLWNKTDEQIRKDLIKAVKKLNKQEQSIFKSNDIVCTTCKSKIHGVHYNNCKSCKNDMY